MKCPECGFKVGDKEAVCPRCLTRLRPLPGEHSVGGDPFAAGADLGLDDGWSDDGGRRGTGGGAGRLLQWALTVFLLLVAIGVAGVVIVSLTRRGADHYADLAAGQYQSGMYETSLASYLRVLDKDPSRADAESGAGWCYLKMGQPSLAIPHFVHAAVIDPELVEAYQGLGMAYSLVQHYPEAESSFRSVLEIRPGDLIASRELAIVYYDQERYDEAIELLQAVIGTLPEDAVAQEYLGRSLYATERYDEALTPLQAALALAPDTETVREFVGRVAYQLRRYDWSLEHFRFLQTRDPGNPLWHAYVGRCLAEEGEHAQAILHLNYALGLAQADVVLNQSHLLLGWSYHEEEQYPEALVAFQRALIMDPRSPEAMAGLGWAYAGLDRCEDATLLFEEALAIDPYLRTAQEGLEECE